MLRAHLSHPWHGGGGAPEGRRVLNALRPAIEAKTPIIGLEPSCLLSLRDELYCLGLGAEVGALGKQLFLLEEFLTREQMRGLNLPFKEIPRPKCWCMATAIRRRSEQ